MAVQFILGRSGTGKTSYCIKAIVNALAEPGEQRLILLVPEQATVCSFCCQARIRRGRSFRVSADK